MSHRIRHNTGLRPGSSSAAPVVLDRVVAVVNNQAILASDVDDEMRLSVLDPGRRGLACSHPPARPGAVDQPRPHPAADSPGRRAGRGAHAGRGRCPPGGDSQESARLHSPQLRLGGGMEGFSGRAWADAGAGRNLSPLPGSDPALHRTAIPPGHSHLPARRSRTITTARCCPSTPPGEAIPPLDQVAPRIEEILLQQQVNMLFDDWLANLRKQGEIEVLDPALETPLPQGDQGKGSP